MQAVFDVVQDRSGNAVAGAYVAVYTASNVLATLYSDNGVTPLVNPTITNFDGEYFFYAPNGTYRIEISATGYAGQSIPGVVLYDPADGVSTGSITYTGTLTGGTGVVDIGSGQFYKNTLGQVGIGTASPLFKLDVLDASAATVRARTTSSGNAALIASTAAGGVAYLQLTNAAGDHYIYGGTGGTQNISFGLGVTEGMRLTSTGLGIGTSSPSAKFEVYQDGNNVLRVGAGATGIAGFNFNGNAGTYNTTSFLVQQSGTRVAQLINLSSNPLLFGTSGNEVARFDASGNLGIGTTSPASKLDVNGVVSVAGLAALRNRVFGYSGSFQAIEIGARNSNNGSVALAVDVSAITGGGFSGQNQVIVPANGLLMPNAAGTDFIGVLARDASNRLLLGPSTASGITSGNVVIDASGNLGLGVTPSAWSVVKALQIGSRGASFYADPGSNQNGLTQNAFNGSLGWTYINTAVAAMYQQSEASHIWWSASSGAAGTAITFINRMQLDPSGNLGLGVTPSAWGNGWKAVELVGGSVASSVATQMRVYQNAFFNGTNTVYKTTNPASLYLQDSGGHYWSSAPSGAAGSNISFTQAMTLDASGNLGVGTTSPSAFGKLAVTGSLGTTYVNDQGVALVMTRTGDNYFNAANGNFNYGAGVHVWTNSAQTVEYARINSSGNLLVGSTATGADGIALGISKNYSVSEGSGASYFNLFRQNVSAATIIANGYKYSGAANGFASSTGGSWAKSAIGLGVSAGAITFYTDAAATVANGTDVTPTERARITSAGNQIDYQPAESAQNTSVTLTVANLQAQIITSNAAVTLTLPTGTTLEGYTSSMATNTAFEVTFIATTASAITIAANGNTTVGSLTVSGNTSGTFRFRKTATNTFTVYRIS